MSSCVHVYAMRVCVNICLCLPVCPTACLSFSMSQSNNFFRVRVICLLMSPSGAISVSSS